MFRATGRFLWVPVYMLMIFTIWASVKRFKKHILVIVAVLLVFVQFVDQYPYLSAKGYIFREEQVFESSLQSELWDAIAPDYDHIVHLNAFMNHKHVSVYAVRNHLTVNNAYVARQDLISIEDYQEYQWLLLLDGLPEKNTIYIFTIIPENLIDENLLFVYLVDEMIIGVANEIENAESMSGVIRLS